MAALPKTAQHLPVTFGGLENCGVYHYHTMMHGNGPPLPLCMLQAAGIVAPDADGSYMSADPVTMQQACRQIMAAWKVSGNGPNIAKCAAHGGPQGSKNPRKSFAAPLADPYTAADDAVLPHVDAALWVMCGVMAPVHEASAKPHVIWEESWQYRPNIWRVSRRVWPMPVIRSVYHAKCPWRRRGFCGPTSTGSIDTLSHK